VLVAAKYGRLLEWGEKADDFMRLDEFADGWGLVLRDFFANYDELPMHCVMHLAHGAQILGYKHPDPRFREKWIEFYRQLVESLHLTPETEVQMDERLGDWARRHW